MKVAVMQPYFFPYWGYFQLINSVDYFVIFDDVNYIKRGWVNKNRILHQGVVRNITLPVQKASQNRKINEHLRTIDNSVINKIKQQIKLAYNKAPYFNELYPIVSQVISHPEMNLAKYLTHSLITLSSYLGLHTKFIYSSDLSNHDDWDNAEHRIISLTKQLKATQYFNLPGGQSIYKKENFIAKNIELKFIAPELFEYQQNNGNSFHSGLSIIDILMYNSKKNVQSLLSEYRLN